MGWERNTWVFWHEFSDIVRPPMYDYPAVFIIVVLRNLIAVKLLLLGLLLGFVIHDCQ